MELANDFNSNAVIPFRFVFLFDKTTFPFSQIISSFLTVKRHMYTDTFIGIERVRRF